MSGLVEFDIVGDIFCDVGKLLVGVVAFNDGSDANAVRYRRYSGFLVLCPKQSRKIEEECLK
jgi:hypothetical protein